MTRRWLLAALLLTSLVAVALWKGPAETRGRAPRSATEPLDPAAPEATPAGGPAAEPVPDAPWSLEVEIRDPSDTPVAGRIYVTNAAGELLSVRDHEATAPAVHKVHGVVNVIAQSAGLGLAPRFVEGIAAPATGVRKLRVRLDAGLEISGTLVDDAGERLDQFDPIRVRIRAEPVDVPWLMPRNSPSWSRLTDSEGHWIALGASRNSDSTFRITGLPPGLYRLRADTTYAKTLLPPEEPPLVRAGARDVVLALRRTGEIKVNPVDADTGERIRGDVVISWSMTTEDGEMLTGGRGARGDSLVLHRPPGTSFILELAAESYEVPRPLRIVVDRDPAVQEIEVRLRRIAGGIGRLELLLRDDAGAPVFPVMIGRAMSSRRHQSADGRYTVEVPAGTQRIELCSPTDQILLFKREWIPSVHDPDDFPPARAYLPQDVQVEVPGGGRVTHEVTVRRAALIWVRHEAASTRPRTRPPEEGVKHGVRLFKDGKEIEYAFWDLYEDKGLVAAVEPGDYVVQGPVGAETVKVEVVARAAEVAEVSLRAGGGR